MKKMFLSGCVVLGLITGAGAAPADQSAKAAIEALRQAPDPSAAISAFANGYALDRNNPELYNAYVARMVDLGLPEVAYHQAQTLTTLQSNNGLAWGVVAYVDARRQQLPDAISAINLAGQFAPDNTFVQHTAGELAAWYDFKADKSTLPESAKTGLAKVRSLLEQRPAFTTAYNTAQKAYQSQANADTQPAAETSGSITEPADREASSELVPNAAQAQVAPLVPQAQIDQQALPPDTAPVYSAPLAPPAYYEPSYYPQYPEPYYPAYSDVYLDWGPAYGYDSGPGWVSPSPWCWWRPYGFWGGANFIPFGVGFALGDFDDFHHHHFDRDGFFHDGFFHHDGDFRHHDRGAFAYEPGRDSRFGHGTTRDRNAFFGTPARGSASATRWARASAQPRAASAIPAGSASRAPSAGWWARSPSMPPAASSRGSWTGTPLARPAPALNPVVRSAGGSLVAPRNMAPLTARPTIAGTLNTTRSPVARSWNGNSSAYSSARSAPARSSWNGYYARSYEAPRSSWTPASRSAAAAPAVPRNSFAMTSRSWSPSPGAWRAASAPRAYTGGWSGGAVHTGGFGASHAAMGGGGFHGSGSGGGGFHGASSGGGFHGGNVSAGHGGGRR